MKTLQRHPDWLIALGLVLAALVLRLPEFMQIPRMSDEGQEALWALDITRGKHFPLTGITPQLGPFLPYLMALGFGVFGPQMTFPRLLTTILSALTVPLTFALGHATRNRAVGIIAALFVLTCPELIVSGHLGWSASLAPFFAIAALAAMTVGWREAKSGLIPASGLLLALTIQGHATSAVLLIGIALWFFSLPRWRALIQSREVLSALGLFVLGCAPQMIAWLGISFDPPLERISGMLAPNLLPAEYVARLIPFVRIGGFFLGGGIGEATMLLRIQAIVVELLFLGGILWMWRAKLRLIPLVLVSSILLLPVFISEVNERYYLYLFPLAYVAIAIFAEGVWTSARNARARWGFVSPIVRVTIGLGLPTVILLLGSISLGALAAYYANAAAQQRTNQEYFRLQSVVRENRACGETLIVEDASRDFSTPITIQSWYSLHTIDYVLTFDQCAHTLTRAGFDFADWLLISEPTAMRLKLDRFETVAEFSLPMIESQPVKIIMLRAVR